MISLHNSILNYYHYLRAKDEGLLSISSISSILRIPSPVVVQRASLRLLHLLLHALLRCFLLLHGGIEQLLGILLAHLLLLLLLLLLVLFVLILFLLLVFLVLVLILVLLLVILLL